MEHDNTKDEKSKQLGRQRASVLLAILAVLVGGTVGKMYSNLLTSDRELFNRVEKIEKTIDDLKRELEEMKQK
jgi:hypothetical protein